MMTNPTPTRATSLQAMLSRLAPSLRLGSRRPDVRHSNKVAPPIWTSCGATSIANWVNCLVAKVDHNVLKVQADQGVVREVLACLCS